VNLFFKPTIVSYRPNTVVRPSCFQSEDEIYLMNLCRNSFQEPRTGFLYLSFGSFYRLTEGSQASVLYASNSLKQPPTAQGSKLFRLLRLSPCSCSCVSAPYDTSSFPHALSALRVYPRCTRRSGSNCSELRGRLQVKLGRGWRWEVEGVDWRSKGRRGRQKERQGMSSRRGEREPEEWSPESSEQVRAPPPPPPLPPPSLPPRKR